MTFNNDELTINLNKKYQNNPGFFEGIIDVINEFAIFDFYQLYTFKEDIILFLKSYPYECLAVNESGEMTTIFYPFQQKNDIVLALYAIVQYLK